MGTAIVTPLNSSLSILHHITGIFQARHYLLVLHICLIAAIATQLIPPSSNNQLRRNPANCQPHN
mgnify:CR=1 FL=1